MMDEQWTECNTNLPDTAILGQKHTMEIFFVSKFPDNFESVHILIPSLHSSVVAMCF